MKPLFQKVLFLAVCVTAHNFYSSAQAIGPQAMISNLNQPWTQGGMGNFGTVSPGSGFGFLFDTGSSPYVLDTVAFEEAGGLGTVQATLFALQGQGNLFAGWRPILTPVGQLGNPVVDSRQTQWPNYTSFVDYTPVTPITLLPNTYYFIAAYEPANGDDNTALTFNFNYSYTVSADWSVPWTIYSSWVYYPNGSQSPPNNLGAWQMDTEYGSMMVEVDATPVPEPSQGVLLFFASGMLLLAGLSGHKKFPNSAQDRLTVGSCRNLQVL